ncbi:MAG: 3-phosphoshikimate 1-carboxyvinyltransferase [Chloroflexi bacterium]|nr:3-phosphoshikimate 1-carboxyvinyltransferase [Chloroflexota bacterium]
MSDPLIVRPAARLRGEVRVPPDKSISHRAALFGAIAAGETRVQGFLDAEDCLATLRCLRALGVQIDEEGRDRLVVHGRGLRGLQPPTVPLDCGGSGTTMRLISGILAGQTFDCVLTSNEALRKRPMDRVIEPLRRMGADISGDRDRFPPLRIGGGQIHGMVYHLPVASAQVKSCLLLAGLYATQPTVLHEPAPSRDHTERMLRAMGVKVDHQDGVITLQPPPTGQPPLAPLDIRVPGDFSSAAFFLVGASLLPNSSLRLLDVNVNPTRTGLYDVLIRMGARIRLENERTLGGEPVADLEVGHNPLESTVVGGDLVPRMIDEFPILAVAATQAQGVTVIRDAAELRVKESDRVATTVAELSRLGARIEERPDGFVVTGPTPLQGAEVDCHKDHRLAMSLAIAGLVARGETVIHNAGSIADSFPGFAEMLEGIIAPLDAERRA